MVQITRIYNNIARIRNKTSNFIDTARIYMKSGSGGTGIPQFGGIGGKGSDMSIVACKHTTFKNFLNTHPDKTIKGLQGSHSKKYCIQAPSAPDVEIKVPVGVTVISDEGKILGDLIKHGDKVLVLEGGEGGNKKNNYLGQKGNVAMIRLDLKLIADVGFVGYPNAGKSTLLRALSNAKPKVASYPFTTLRPELGVAEYKDLKKIMLADLPGLIEGAHLNYGMGHKFLKHVERTSFLLFVVDIHGFRFNKDTPMRNAFESVVFLNKELELYQENLVDKPALLVLNKIDKNNSDKKVEEFNDMWKNYDEVINTMEPEYHPIKKMKFDDIISISAMRGIHTKLVKERIRELITLHEEMEFAPMLQTNSILDIRKEDENILM